MKIKPYLTFNLHDVQYGIEANLVKEIFLLPELIPIAEAPIDIVGILNLREKILPVMHLDLRLGNPMQECRLRDSVIVLEWEGVQIGVIVNTVHEVINIEAELIENEIDYGRIRNINPAFVTGIAKVDESAIVLLNSEALIRQPDAVNTLLEEAEKDSNGNPRDHSELAEESESNETVKMISSFYNLCCPNATPEERAIFRRRADNLRQSNTEAISDFTGQIPLAIIGLNDEYFGLDLEAVREFINIRNFTPIPCCPQHIVGNMNLRGEIVTLVDIRSALSLPLAATKTGSKAVVIEVDDLVAGLPVDEVFDVMYLHPKKINPVPVAVESGSNEYLRGTAPYFEKILSVLDLSKIISDRRLEVNETV